MYRMFMNNENSSFLERALNCLAKEVGAREGDQSFWVCYGSFVLNQQTLQSDVDLLYIHNQQLPIQRIQSSFEGHPVTIYSLSKNNFASDGEKRLFGGYFSGKVLNPYAMFSASSEDRNTVVEVGGAFIGPFASAMAKLQERESATKANLVADSVLARFHLCPWYQSYFLRYYIAPNFSQLWGRMETVVPLSLVRAGVVVQEGDRFHYCRTTPDKELHDLTISSVACFWALGSCLHGSMPDFPRHYIQKAEQFVRERKLEQHCEEMVRFLREKSSFRD